MKGDTNSHLREGFQSQFSKSKNCSENGLGIAGFILSVLAILCFWIPVLGQILWFLGLLFSFRGIFKAPKSFAVAGLIVSLIGFFVFILGIAFFAAMTVFSKQGVLIN